MDLWVREARLFKYGSGTGTNFSALRGEGEKLSGGGKSSGLMSFLKIGDRAAGAIKSGGTTRRAAKMVIVDVDHPDIETYIDWKVMEEQKVAALVTGSKINQKHLKRDPEGLRQLRRLGRRLLLARQEPGAQARDQAGAQVDGAGQLHQARHPVRQAGLQGHRLPDLRHRLGFGSLSHRRPGRTRTIRCASPTTSCKRGRGRRRLGPDLSQERQGRQDRSRRASCGRRSATPPGPPPIPACNTTPRSTTGTPARRRAKSAPAIRARNTCSSTTPPAISPRSTCSTFRDVKTGKFDVAGYEHAVRLWTIVLEISVLMAQFPSRRSPSCPTNSARSAWATPISAAC